MNYTIIITFKDDKRFIHIKSRFMIYESIRYITIYQEAIPDRQEEKTFEYNLDEIKSIEMKEGE